MALPTAADVFAPCEVARAAGVSDETVDALIRSGAIRTMAPGARPFIDGAEALRVTRALKLGLPVGRHEDRHLLLGGAPPPSRARGLFAASSGLHLGLVLVLVAAGWGTGHVAQATPPAKTSTRLIYLTLAGPGGGGGGGGARTSPPPRRAERRGRARTSSPVPPRVAPPEMAPQLAAAPEPVLEAPVVPAAADQQEAPGVLEAPAEPALEGAGRGTGEGAGTGSGAGIGEGTGDGIGEGEGGGTGGGPYRPGSGVEPPSLLHEVKPAYTETARAGGIQGDVLLEIVVRRDGSVGDVRIVRGLGYGLDERAVEAVRLWRFAAARRTGVPVDVVVEVAMEFRLR